MNRFLRAYEGKDPYLFVSYAHKDSDTVLPILQGFFDQKYRIWYDEGIAPGSEWPENIERHLSNASAVLIFVSHHSLASPNCNNEIAVAVRQNKQMFVIYIEDDIHHPLLTNFPTFTLTEDVLVCLINQGGIGNEFIGDGITGYEYLIEKKETFNVWNIMLGFAAMLAVFVSISLYGLYHGWFDEYLPARQQTLQVEPTEIDAKEETVSVKQNLMGTILPVEFNSNEEKMAVYQKLGWSLQSEMTYNDLISMEGLERLDLYLNDGISDLTFASFLPDLKILSLHDSAVTDLTPLVNCYQLTTVEVTVQTLSLLKLPKNRDFEIILVP
jgi:hypothetical protein